MVAIRPRVIGDQDITNTDLGSSISDGEGGIETVAFKRRRTTGGMPHA